MSALAAALRGLPLVDASSLRLEVFLPKSEGSMSHDYWVQAVATLLSRVAGGCTISYDARGCWVNALGDLVEEPCTIVWSYVSEAKLLAWPDDPGTSPAITLRKLLVQFGRETEQEVVAFALDGQLYGFNPREVL